jgi:hypothetical protein
MDHLNCCLLGYDTRQYVTQLPPTFWRTRAEVTKVIKGKTIHTGRNQMRKKKRDNPWQVKGNYENGISWTQLLPFSCFLLLGSPPNSLIS